VWGGGSGESSVFSTTDSLGDWIDPFSHTILWSEFAVYGVPDSLIDEDCGWDEDYSKAVLMGGIRGCHIPVSLIANLGEEPYEVCDASDADLEAMYSVLQEYNDGELLDFVGDIYYIHEIELNPEYRGYEYEELLLLQLPAIITKSLRVFPDLLMYLPTLLDSEMGNVDDTDSRSRSNWQRMLVKDGERDPNLYKTYKTVGFAEIGKTGWLYKQITSVFSLDGKARQATDDDDSE
jgi:hypothetical protein